MDKKNKKKISKSQSKSRHYLEMVEQIFINISELPGAIFRILDKWWKFYAPGRQEHAGACIECDENKRIATMVKGTGEESKLISSKSYVTIYPTDNNGLKKPTYFHLQPRPFRFHRIFLLYPERYIGRLDEEDLKLIRDKLHQLFLETLRE